MNQSVEEEWTTEEVETLIRLLEKVKADSGWWPTEECMRAAHGAISTWAPELVIEENPGARRGNKILLTKYEGGVSEFNGIWHIPGGYASIIDKDIQATCSRIAKRELDVDVTFISLFPVPHFWRHGEHPYGHPLSLYSFVRPRGNIVETDSRRFLGRKDLPDNLLPVHRRFIEKFIFSSRYR